MSRAVLRRATVPDMNTSETVTELDLANATGAEYESLAEQNERNLLAAGREVPVTDMPSFSIRMPQQLCDQVMRLAEQDERTWSWMMRRLVEEAVLARGVTPYRAPGLHLT